MFHNVVIGKPIVKIETLLATDKKDWEENEKEKTLFTETRFLLMITLDKPDCINIKWGKKFLYIVVGE